MLVDSTIEKKRRSLDCSWLTQTDKDRQTLPMAEILDVNLKVLETDEVLENLATEVIVGERAGVSLFEESLRKSYTTVLRLKRAKSTPKAKAAPP